MRGFLKHLRARWDSWCGDREMEMAIRNHLDAAGFFGRSAQLSNIRLVAVQRPGWVQVYRFDCTARRNASAAEQDASSPAGHTLFGLVRDDGRKGSEVRTFSQPQERSALFASWSDGLITLRGATDI